MAPLQSLASATLLFLSVANAHFNLNIPPSFGFDESKEDSAPCGGFTPNFDDKSKVSDFHVGGEAIGVKLGHTQANWLYRATLGGSDSKNWTQLFPIVQQSGLGLFCEPSVTAPEAWVGKQGILSVVADAPDGLLYQCAPVNFVSGEGKPGSDCKNSSITAAFVSDPALTAMVGGSSGGDNSSSGTGSTSPTGTGTGSGSSPTPTGNAAPAMLVPGSFAIGTIVPVAMGLLGFALL